MCVCDQLQGFIPQLSSIISTSLLTFDGGVGRRALHSQVPRRVALIGKVPHLQVADGESDDGCLVQLTGDGTRKRQHLGQLVKLKVLFAPPRPCCIPGLLLPQSLQPERRREAVSWGKISTRP